MNKIQTRQPLRRRLDFTERPACARNILETIGGTPLVRLNQVLLGLVSAVVLAKLEMFNPGGSVKDRIGVAIIEEAEREGRLKPGGTVVEATSGNTGVGLAIAAAVKGYKTVFVMPDKMSEEKVRLLRAYGARVVITPTAVAPDDPRSYYSVAARIVKETPNSILANQYHNPANPAAHYRTTGPEIWRQTGGRIDLLIAGLGTGGTISGAARYLREQNPAIQVVGIDILGSLLYEAWKLGRMPTDPHPKTYKVEGIGEDFIPSTLDLSLIDEVVQVDDRESFLAAVDEEPVVADRRARAGRREMHDLRVGIRDDDPTSDRSLSAFLGETDRGVRAVIAPRVVLKRRWCDRCPDDCSSLHNGCTRTVEVAVVEGDRDPDPVVGEIDGLA